MSGTGTSNESGTARLLSVNVGLPREVEWEGKVVRSAIWKEPVDGPRMVRTINIDGDDQADRQGHGGEHRAVFVYQIESYKYWERELDRDDFVPGQFGENFTVAGLADDAVCIGDRYRIGGALFEVTQPRVTCFRVGIRMGVPEMPSLLVGHHRPGFYLRVLEEGEVEAGAEIVKVADGPERLTVADVDGLLYLPRKSRGLLERALRIPALSEGWKGSFRELLDAATATAAAPSEAPAWSGFRALRVTAIERESDTISSFHLVAGDGAGTPACASASSARAPSAASCTTASASATCSTSPRPAARSCSVRSRGRSCWSARASARRPSWRCCTSSSPTATRGRCGGSTAPATPASTRSRARPSGSWPPSPTPTGSSPTARRPPRRRATNTRTMTSRGAWTSPRCGAPASPSTPTTTSAGRRASCGRSPRRSPRAAWRRGES
jgi:MOSC domain-containing protein YiiM